MIPKRIHQTFPVRALPERLRDNVVAIQAQNADFSYRLYDDGDILDFIRKHYGSRMLAIYLSINPRYGAARADLFRYLLIYQLGGVYLDIKSTTTVPLRTVLRSDDRLVLSYWASREGRGSWGRHEEVSFTNRGELQQWHIIAEQGHRLFALLIEEVCQRIKAYRPWSSGSGWKSVLRTTGPIVYTQVLASRLPMSGVRVVEGENQLGLEYTIYGDSGSEGHKQLFANHYESVDTPLILPRNLRGVQFRVFYKQAQLRSTVKSMLNRR